MTEELRRRAKELGFYAIASNFDEYVKESWLVPLIKEEEKERARRSLDRRIKEARLGTFKQMADFDWGWPTQIDRDHIEDMFNLQFLEEAANVVLIGPNGIGKTMIAQNLAYQALMSGHSTRYTTASTMLVDLSNRDGAYARKRCLRKYTQVDVLVIDEVGYLRYGDNYYADLLYEVINERYSKRSTIITTNKAFKEWGEVFPNAGCVVTLVDRLTHKAEITSIKGKSYRHKEAEERAAAKEKLRLERKGKLQGKNNNAKSTAPD